MIFSAGLKSRQAKPLVEMEVLVLIDRAASLRQIEVLDRRQAQA